MTLNSATKVLGISLLMLPVQALGANPKATVTAIVKLNDRTKEIDGETYQLVAVRYNWWMHISETSGARDVFWLIRGQPEQKVLRPVEKHDLPAGKLPPGVVVWWMMLPPKGNLELLYGAVSFPKFEKPAELRKQLLEYHLPFVIDVEKIPIVKAESTEDLVQAIDEIAAGAYVTSGGVRTGKRPE